MKLRTIIVSTISVLSLGFAAVSFAGSKGTNSIYPPERINCSLESGKLSCEGFNHQYLVEDTYTADLSTKEQAFAFRTGVAYFTADHKEASVFFTYRDANNKLVKLKSTHSSSRPDFENGSWLKMDEDLYVCRDGYMNCPIVVG